MKSIRLASALAGAAIACAALLGGCASGEGASSGAASQAPSSAPATTAAPAKNTTVDFRKQGDTDTLGVWWWQVATVKSADAQLKFLQENAVSEIYLCIDGMSEASNAKATFADVRAFVKKAGQIGMRVAALTGDYAWINPDSTGFEAYVEKFKAYQAAAAEDEKFYSMHLDVEPHQHPDFKTGEEGRASSLPILP